MDESNESTDDDQRQRVRNAAPLEESYSDAVVSAAEALANFGNFQWSTFLEGSGIEEKKSSLKLDSDLVLDMYTGGQSGSRKRKMSSTGEDRGGETSGGNALPICLVSGCNFSAESEDALYCTAHRGTRRCQKEGCGKCAQGATKYCIAHGGGRRCTHPGCFKGARDKLFCAAHGGGKRCSFDGCTKSAVGGSSLCTAHGGGKRCKFEGCNKSSQSSTDYCVKHGGGRSCIWKGCIKVARGKTDYCAAHGGGIRCKAKGCYKIAVGATSLCRMHSSAQAAAASAATAAASSGKTNSTAFPSSSSASYSSQNNPLITVDGMNTNPNTTTKSESETQQNEALLTSQIPENKLVRNNQGNRPSSSYCDSDEDDDSDMDEAQVIYGRH